MKSFLTLSFVLAISLIGSAQPVQLTTTRGTLVNTSGNSISIYAKPADALPNRLFRAIQFSVSIPDQGASNPVASVETNFVSNLSWSQLTPVLFNGRYYYTFQGTDNGGTTTTSWTTGNNRVVSILFSSNAGLSSIQLNDETPTYGPNSSMAWYVEVINTGDGDITDYPQKFYGVNPLPVNNQNSPSSVGLQPLSILPALLLDFNVNKQGNFDAALNWSTAQEQNVSHFVLERSANGASGWSKIGEVKAKGNSSTPTKYNYTDVKAYDGVSASKTLFYRIKVVDLDGQERIFPVRSIKFSATGAKEIGLYPNPARDGFTLTIPLVNPNQGKLRLNLVNRIGQVVHAREINASVASNYYYDIKTPGIINGEYMLQIVYEGEVLETKKVIVQR